MTTNAAAEASVATRGSLWAFVLCLSICSPLLVSHTEAVRTTIQIYNGTECIDGPSIWYDGTRNYTKSGIPCQRWDVQTPHKPIFTPRDGGAHNFCRNPDHDQMGTWCYTTNASVKWEYCAIPKCPDDSIVAWTSYHVGNKTAKVLSFEADPEIVRQRAGSSPSVSIKPVFASGRVPAEYWTLASDYSEQKIFFLDYRSSYFGVHDLKANKTTVHLEGMGAGVEGIAYDWMTKNLYWTDSEQNWVMVGDSEFNHYAPVYQPEDETPYAITVHSRHRKLFVSLFKTMGSKIITLDMAGGNRTDLFTFPEVFDVTGLTIDYTDEKLYWTDFTGYGSLVVCSGLDGKNKTRKYFSTSSILWGVASYLNYIYATDVRTRFMVEGKYFYVWWISKTQTADSRLKLGNYRLSEKPRGITVLSKNEEYSLVEDEELGSCDQALPCDHLCLPMIGKPRVCVCSVGYELVDGTQCKAKRTQSDRILLADQGQAKIFQLGITQGIEEEQKTAVVEIKTKASPYAVDISSVSELIFWSDIKTKTINKASSDGTYVSTIYSNRTVKAMALEPRLDLLYFADDYSQYIYVGQQSGLYARPIMTQKSNVSRIGKIAIDYSGRYVYWSDTHATEGKGQVLRMKYDGTGRTVIFDSLNWPEAITVDNEGQRLFVADSKLGMIYEYSLRDLDGLLEGQAAGGVTNKTWHVSKSTERPNVFISDIKVSGTYLYMFDKVTTHIERFNLEPTPASISVTEYGPALFYRIHSFAIYTESLKDHIKAIPNPCRIRPVPCHHICVSITQDATACVCNEGYRLKPGSETECMRLTTDQDLPPEPLNCPDDIETIVGPCADSTIFYWDRIEWYDAHTSSENLKIDGPAAEAKVMKLGETTITYTATDENGNVGECIFSFRLTQEKCPPIPSLDPRIFAMTGAVCDEYSKRINISCVDPTKQIRIAGRSAKQITIECQQPSQWVPATSALMCMTRKLTTNDRAFYHT